MKTIFNKIKFAVLSLFVIAPVAMMAQEAAGTTGTKEIVKSTFENGVLINNQTVEGPNRKSLDFMIQHRFGLIKDEKDLYGFFAPANVRLGLNYGITKRISVGIGAAKLKRYYDLQWKVILLQQTKSGGSPVTISYHGDLARSANDKSKFLNQDSTYKGSNRINYFHELMIARKFSNKISFQVAATYTHYNISEAITVVENNQSLRIKFLVQHFS